MAIKPQKGKYAVTIEYDYWRCLNNDHKHSDYDVAEKCIASHGKNKQPRRPKEWLIENYMQVIRDREVDKKTFREIGLKYGVSPTQGDYLYCKAIRIRDKLGVE